MWSHNIILHGGGPLKPRQRTFKRYASTTVQKCSTLFRHKSFHGFCSNYFNIKSRWISCELTEIFRKNKENKYIIMNSNRFFLNGWKPLFEQPFLYKHLSIRTIVVRSVFFIFQPMGTFLKHLYIKSIFLLFRGWSLYTFYTVYRGKESKEIISS